MQMNVPWLAIAATCLCSLISAHPIQSHTSDEPFQSSDSSDEPFKSSDSRDEPFKSSGSTDEPFRSSDLRDEQVQSSGLGASNVHSAHGNCARYLQDSGLERRALHRRVALASNYRAAHGLGSRRRYLHARSLQKVLRDSTLRSPTSALAESRHSASGSSTSIDPDWRTISTPSAPFASNPICTQSQPLPDNHYIPGQPVGGDAIQSQAGVNLVLEVQVINIRTCEPIPHVHVEFWGANPSGVYSDDTTVDRSESAASGSASETAIPSGDESDRTPPHQEVQNTESDREDTNSISQKSSSDQQSDQSNEQSSNQQNESTHSAPERMHSPSNWLRGIVPTDDAGVTQIHTLFPGRKVNDPTPPNHLNLLIRHHASLSPDNNLSAGTISHVGAVYFDPALVQHIEQLPPYGGDFEQSPVEQPAEQAPVEQPPEIPVQTSPVEQSSATSPEISVENSPVESIVETPSETELSPVEIPVNSTEQAPVETPIDSELEASTHLETRSIDETSHQDSPATSGDNSEAGDFRAATRPEETTATSNDATPSPLQATPNTDDASQSDEAVHAVHAPHAAARSPPIPVQPMVAYVVPGESVADGVVAWITIAVDPAVDRPEP